MLFFFKSLDAIIYDTNLFISNTVDQIDYFTNENFDELTDKIDEVIEKLENDADEVGVYLLDESGYRDITEITKYLNYTLDDFVEVESVTIVEMLNNGTASLEDLQSDLETFQAADWSELTSPNAFCTDWGNTNPSDSGMLTCAELIAAKDAIPALDTTVFNGVIATFETEVGALSLVIDPLAGLTNILVDGENMLGNLSGQFDLTELTDVIDGIKEDVQEEINVVLDGFEDIELERPAELDELQSSLDEYGSYATYAVMYVPTVIISLSLLLLVSKHKECLEKDRPRLRQLAFAAMGT